MKKIFSALMACLMMTSCVDTDILPESKIIDVDFWKTRENVSYLVNNTYKLFLDEEYMRNLITWTEFRSDALILNDAVTGSMKDDFDEISMLTTKTDNTLLSWANLYSIINYSNIIIEKAGGVMNIDPNYTEGNYKSDISQAKALRSLAFFNLVRCFRDVPMPTKAYMAKSEVGTMPQTAPGTIIDYCIQSCIEAQDGAMSARGYETYYVRNSTITDEGIWALLADLYLWRASVMHSAADYQECVKYCDKIIESRHATFLSYRDCEKDNPYWMPYSGSVLKRDYNILNSHLSDEVIFTIMAGTNTNPGMSSMYNWINKNSKYPYLRVPAFFGTTGSSETNVFTSDNDLRKSLSLKNDNSDTYLVGKQIDSDFDHYTNNWTVYRLSDVILMKAEAEVQLGNLDSAYEAVKAVWDHNMKEDTPLNQPTTAKAMEELVLAERMRELCFEGKRWFDLLRYNYRHVDDVDYYSLMTQQQNHSRNFSDMLKMACRKFVSAAAIAAKMQTEPYLYMPIKQSEVDVNNELKQNPVYKAVSTLK